MSNPSRRLKLQDIYHAIEKKYPYFRTAGDGWKNSVRHNLSLVKAFEKVARPHNEPGKGGYWTVSSTPQPPGPQRTRVRPRASVAKGKLRSKKGKEKDGDELSSTPEDPDYPDSGGSYPTGTSSFGVELADDSGGGRPDDMLVDGKMFSTFSLSSMSPPSRHREPARRVLEVESEDDDDDSPRSPPDRRDEHEPRNSGRFVRSSEEPNLARSHLPVPATKAWVVVPPLLPVPPPGPSLMFSPRPALTSHNSYPSPTISHTHADLPFSSGPQRTETSIHTYRSTREPYNDPHGTSTNPHKSSDPADLRHPPTSYRERAGSTASRPGSEDSDSGRRSIISSGDKQNMSPLSAGSDELSGRMIVRRHTGQSYDRLQRRLGEDMWEARTQVESPTSSTSETSPGHTGHY